MLSPRTKLFSHKPSSSIAPSWLVSVSKCSSHTFHHINYYLQPAHNSLNLINKEKQKTSLQTTNDHLSKKVDSPALTYLNNLGFLVLLPNPCRYFILIPIALKSELKKGSYYNFDFKVTRLHLCPPPYSAASRIYN